MSKNKILILVLGLVAVMAIGAQAADKSAGVTKASCTVSDNGKTCCEGTPVNCETGKACTPEEMEECQAQCEGCCANMKGNDAQRMNRPIGQAKANCQPDHQCRKAKLSNPSTSSANVTTIGAKAKPSGQAANNTCCQPKQCRRNGSV